MDDKSIIQRLRIKKILNETKDAKTFVLEPLDNWKPVYRAGQFITLVFKTKYGEKRRSYSLSSLWGLEEHVCITIKKVENGEFSRLMLDRMNEGDILHSSGIGGLFVLPDIFSPAGNFCFIAAGSGIVPCYSLIKTLLADTSTNIILIYSNKNKEETIFYEALQKLTQEYYGRLQIKFLFSESNDVYNKRLSKWLLEQLLKQYLKKEIHNTLFYICGPFDYMQTVEITLRIQVSKENIIHENFSSFPRLVIPEPPDKKEHQVQIRLHGKTHLINVKYPKSILASAKDQNIVLPYSCEAGRCSSCIATCSQGKIWMAYNEVLTDKEILKGRILVCQSFPIEGDAEIVYDLN